MPQTPASPLVIELITRFSGSIAAKRVSTEDVPAILLWAFGVGCYNLFLACGVITGVIALPSGNETVGRTLVIYTCLFMFLSGIVLFIADRIAQRRALGKGIGGA